MTNHPAIMTMQPLHCGDLVIEIGGRHIGNVRSIALGNDRALTCTIEWIDTGWMSYRVPVEDLAFAPTSWL